MTVAVPKIMTNRNLAPKDPKAVDMLGIDEKLAVVDVSDLAHPKWMNHIATSLAGNVEDDNGIL